MHQTAWLYNFSRCLISYHAIFLWAYVVLICMHRYNIWSFNALKHVAEAHRLKQVISN